MQPKLHGVTRESLSNKVTLKLGNEELERAWYAKPKKRPLYLVPCLPRTAQHYVNMYWLPTKHTEDLWLLQFCGAPLTQGVFGACGFAGTVGRGLCRFPGSRICFHACSLRHRVQSQSLISYWTENLRSWMTFGQRSPSGPCCVGLSLGQLTTLRLRVFSCLFVSLSK